MYRKSQTGNRRQYPKAPGFNSPVHSSPAANESDQQQWSSNQNWPANNTLHGGNVNVYNPHAYGSQQPQQYSGMMNQPVHQPKTGSNFVQDSSWDWQVPESNGGQTDPSWDWNVPDSAPDSGRQWNNQPQDSLQKQQIPANVPQENPNLYSNNYYNENLTQPVDGYGHNMAQQQFPQNFSIPPPSENKVHPAQQPQFQVQPSLSNTAISTQYSSAEYTTATSYQYSNAAADPMYLPHADSQNTQSQQQNASFINQDSVSPAGVITPQEDRPFSNSTPSDPAARSSNSNFKNPDDQALYSETDNAGHHAMNQITNDVKNLDLSTQNPPGYNMISNPAPQDVLPIQNDLQSNSNFSQQNPQVNTYQQPPTSSDLSESVSSDQVQNERVATNLPVSSYSQQNGAFSSQYPNASFSNPLANEYQERNGADISTKQLFDNPVNLIASNSNTIDQLPDQSTNNHVECLPEVENQEVIANQTAPYVFGSNDPNSADNGMVVNSQESFYEQKEEPQKISPMSDNLQHTHAQNLIQPRNESPFKPIYRKSPDTASQDNSNVMYHHTASPISQDVSNIPLENVNLESFPENLEKPADADAVIVKSQTPENTVQPEINPSVHSDSPRTTLWENPDVHGPVSLALPSKMVSQSPEQNLESAPLNEQVSLSNPQDRLDQPADFVKNKVIDDKTTSANQNKINDTETFPPLYKGNSANIIENVENVQNGNLKLISPIVDPRIDNAVPRSENVNTPNVHTHQKFDSSTPIHEDKGFVNLENVKKEVRGQIFTPKLESENIAENELPMHSVHQYQSSEDHVDAPDKQTHDNRSRSDQIPGEMQYPSNQMNRNEDYEQRLSDKQYQNSRESKYDERRSHYPDKYEEYDDRQPKYEEENAKRDDRTRSDRYDDRDRGYNSKGDRWTREDREHRPRDLSSTRYENEDDSYRRNSYYYKDRNRYDSTSSRYENDWNYRDSSKPGYDGRYSRDHSPSDYGRRSRDQSRSRYDDYYNKKDNSRSRDNYYERNWDHSTNPNDRDRPSSRHNYDERYHNYDDSRRYHDYRRKDDYYSRDRPGYNNQYNQMARERDYFYRKLYYDSFRTGNMGSYSYGYYDELYNSDPRYREQIDKYREYYSKSQGYTTTDYNKSSVQSSGRNSVTNELRPNESFSFQHPQPNASVLSYELSSINPDASANNFTNYPDGYNAAEEKLASPIEPVAQEPLKFTSPHVVGRFSNSGQLIKVLPNEPRAGAPPIVEIMEINSSVDESYKHFPGPLLIGETHKNDVIQYCKSKLCAIQSSSSITDKESACLIWEYLILMIRQNGSVAGTDIADLLLKDHSHFSNSQRPGNKTEVASPDEGIFEGGAVADTSSQKSTPEESDHMAKIPLQTSVVDKFREYLLFGHKKDALEWAVRNGLWGHALFLASKMDKRTHANIMTKFANSLLLNDPLQTLYQLMSGRQPASVTCVADEKWGDWRQHLAMILSNPTVKNHVDRKSISTLGDTLATRGCLHAAHFCYLMANCNFGNYASKSSKLVLIGSSHQQGFKYFATNEAIQCTEVFEYAKKLAQPQFLMTSFQQYRFMYAVRLIENGFYEEGLHYCEVIANEIQKSPAVFSPEFISQLFEIASKLKFNDPHYTHNDGDLDELQDPQWIVSLNSIIQAYKSGTIQHIIESDYTGSMSSLPTNECDPSENQNLANANQYTGNSMHISYPGGNLDQYQPDPNVNQGQNQNDQTIGHQNISDQVGYQYTHEQQVDPNEQGLDQYRQVPQTEVSDSTGQADYQYTNYEQQWNQQDAYNMPYSNQQTNAQDSGMLLQSNTEIPNYSSSFDYYAAATTNLQKQAEPERRDSDANSSIPPNRRRDSRLSSEGSEPSMQKQPPPSNVRKSDKPKQQAANGGGILYGLFQKLSFRPKNQMILPDDKDPAIVWDPDTNQWVNKDGDDETSVAGPAAPPTDSALSGMDNPVPPTANIPSIPSSQNDNILPSQSVENTGSSGPNKFQRLKKKGMRSNYVDVFGSKSQEPSSANTFMPPPTLPAVSNSQPGTKPMYFVPPSVQSNESADFISQNKLGNLSSDSNTTADHSGINQPPGMKMFNPSDFNSQPNAVPNAKPRLGRLHPR